MSSINPSDLAMLRKEHSWESKLYSDRLSRLETQPESFTVSFIHDCTRGAVSLSFVESLVRVYGVENFMRDSCTRPPFAKDSFGELFAIDVPLQGQAIILRVLNATPEPDGTVRDFYMRVPNRMRNPRAAVAWTFGMSERQYHPMIEA